MTTKTIDPILDEDFDSDEYNDDEVQEYSYTLEELNAYALGLNSTSMWAESYQAYGRTLEVKQDDVFGTHVELPVEFMTERRCVSSVDEGDNLGWLTINMILAIPCPDDISVLDTSYAPELIKKLDPKLKSYKCATSFEAELTTLSQEATDHIINRFGKEYLAHVAIGENQHVIPHIKEAIAVASK